MRYLLLLLFGASLALAQPAPGPAFPTPPATPPGAGAPTLGQPGHLRPGVRVEPGPQPKRRLPETPETREGPGIWASEAPAPAGGPSLFGVPLPFPPEERDPHTSFFAARCSILYLDVAQRLEAPPKVAALGDDARKCLVAKLHEHCLLRLRNAVDIARRSAQQYDAIFSDSLRRNEEMATRYRRVVCRTAPWPDDADSLLLALKMGLLLQRGL